MKEQGNEFNVKVYLDNEMNKGLAREEEEKESKRKLEEKRLIALRVKPSIAVGTKCRFCQESRKDMKSLYAFVRTLEKDYPACKRCARRVNKHKDKSGSEFDINKELE
jgi:hypothetical protein